MMISSGSPGMTRKTLLTSEEALSQNPPRNAPPTPKNIDRTTVIAPASTPMTTDPVVPATTWPNTSWPMLVVPNQCSALGGWSPTGLDWLGLGTRNGARIARRPKKAQMAIPTQNFHPRGVRRRPVARPAARKNPVRGAPPASSASGSEPDSSGSASSCCVKLMVLS